MRIRAQPFPKTISDVATTLFLMLTIPVTYWFEVWIVTPALSINNTFFFTLNFMIGTFVLINIISNMMALMLCNTSIIGERIIRPTNASSKLWKFCAICESVTPPRSWHCPTCRVCILKRDHHCMFTGKMEKQSQYKNKYMRLT